MRSTKKAYTLDEESGRIIGANDRTYTEEGYYKMRDYRNGYIKDYYRSFLVRFNNIDDAPLIEFLESKENLVPYLRELIGEDMRKQGLDPQTDPEQAAAMKEERRKEKVLNKLNGLRDELRKAKDNHLSDSEIAVLKSSIEKLEEKLK